jgi:hypothetical protein
MSSTELTIVSRQGHGSPTARIAPEFAANRTLRRPVSHVNDPLVVSPIEPAEAAQMTRTFIAFFVCQSFVVLFIALHDWLSLGRLNNLAAVRAADSTARLFFVTALSTLPFAIGLAASAHYAGGRNPHWLTWLLWISYLLGVYGMLRAWYWPYLFGGDLERIRRYQQRFANTHAFLPTMHGIRPDTLHVCFHAALIATLALLAILTFRDHTFAFS